MNGPIWWDFLILGVAAWSTFQLLSEDKILDKPRRWLLRLDPAWEKEGDPVPENYRAEWAFFLTCPYCSGFWIFLAWYAGWLIDEKWAMYAAAGMAGRALVVAGAKLLGPEDEE